MPTQAGRDFTRRKRNCICIYTVDKDPRRLDLEGLIKKLRHITLATQLMPFIYGGFYILSLFLYTVGTEETARLCDTLFYVPPIVVIEFLVLSRLLRLCKWHRIACCVPLIPQVISAIDYYIIELSEIIVQVDIFIYMSSIILLLIAAYKVFLC